MTNERVKIATIVLCGIIIALMIGVIILQSISLAYTLKQEHISAGDTNEPEETTKPATPSTPDESEQQTTPTDFSNKKLTFLGDSITYGVDGVDGQHMMSYPLPILVEKELNASYSANLGISGSTLCAASENHTVSYDNHPFVERINSIPSDSDVVCVFGGVNDYALGLPLGAIDDDNYYTVYGALNGIMKQLQTRCPNAFVFLMTPFGLCQRKIDASPADYELNDVVTAIKLIGEKYNVPVLDLYNDCDWRQTEMLASNSDGIHPSQYYMARYVAPMVADFIRDKH